MQSAAPSGLQIDDQGRDEALSRTQRLATIGTLTASIAHELTNPLNIITTTSNSLLSHVADDDLTLDELLHYIEMIDQSAWRCARLVQTLRTYSHISSSEFVWRNLNEIIEDSLTLVNYQLERQFNAVVVSELEAELEPIFCDPNEITQVLINLLTNARDALPVEGGVIRVGSWTLRDENAQAFSVSDNGSGIDPDQMDLIFEPFFTTKSREQGTGLGLAIVDNIVKRHGGRITAECGPEGGTAFTVVLPIAP